MYMMARLTVSYLSLKKVNTNTMVNATAFPVILYWWAKNLDLKEKEFCEHTTH